MYPYAHTVRLLAAAVIVVAVVVIGGWTFDVSMLRSVIPGAVGMKATTAFGLICASVAICVLAKPQRGRARWIAAAFATLPGLLGIAVLTQYIFGWNLAIDEFPFVDREGRANRIAYPGRLAPTTAACFVLLTLAILSREHRVRRGWRTSEVLALPIFAIAGMSLIGYAYSIPQFYGPASAAKMAVNTAACFAMLAFCVLVMRPHGRLLDLVITPSAPGLVFRRMFPFAVVAPLVLGWLRLRATDWGVFDDAVGTWWVSAATIACFALVIWRCTEMLRRSEARRDELEAKLRDLAGRDDLTGLANRRRFEEELGSHTIRARRYGGTGALLVLDLDRLKAVNDQFGHLHGDRLLREVANVIDTRIRESDVAARLGGDEFAVLLPHTGADGAELVAEHLVAAIRNIRLGAEDDFIWTTASAGVLTLDGDDGHDHDQLLALADSAMYRAKRAGGDQVALGGHRRAAVLR